MIFCPEQGNVYEVFRLKVSVSLIVKCREPDCKSASGPKRRANSPGCNEHPVGRAGGKPHRLRTPEAAGFYPPFFPAVSLFLNLSEKRRRKAIFLMIGKQSDVRERTRALLQYNLLCRFAGGSHLRASESSPALDNFLIYRKARMAGFCNMKGLDFILS